MPTDRYSLKGMFRDGFICLSRCSADCGWRVAVTLSVPDVVTGRPERITCISHWPGEEEPDPEFVWRCLLSAVEHEAAEAFHVDGKQLRDPHQGQRPG